MKYIRTKDGHIYGKPPFSKSISQRTLQPIMNIELDAEIKKEKDNE